MAQSMCLSLGDISLGADTNVLVLVVERGCLACAYSMGLELRDKIGGSNKQFKFIIINQFSVC